MLGVRIRARWSVRTLFLISSIIIFIPIFSETLNAGFSAVYPNSTLVTEMKVTSGSGTFTVPAGVTQIFVEVQGGGGGGGGVATNANKGAGGGGGAGYASATLNTIAGRTFTFVVGAGGTGASAGDNDGGTGGQSGFYNATYYINATGGIKGLKGSTAVNKGLNGTGKTNAPGGIIYRGGNGSSISSTRNSGAGGSGASRGGVGLTAVGIRPGFGILPYSGVGKNGLVVDGTGTNGFSYGAGGSGGSCDTSCTGKAGGAGAIGMIAITYYRPKVESFPQIINTTYGGQIITNRTDHTIVIPQGFSSGDKIVIFFSSDDGSTVTMKDLAYTKLYQTKRINNVTQAVFYKTANGSETTAIVNTSSLQTMTYRAMTIKNGGSILYNTTNGSSTNANAPLLNTGSSANYLWLVFGSWDGDAIMTITATPTQFTNRFYTTNPHPRCVTTAVVGNFSVGQSYDPSAFTSSVEQWIATTLAIPYSAPVTSSCNYSGSGNWIIQGSDHCQITEDVTVSGYLKCVGSNYVNDWIRIVAAKVKVQSLNITGCSVNLSRSVGTFLNITG